MLKKVLRYTLLLLLLLAGNLAISQTVKKIPADKQRALRWKPEQGQYYFSHSIVLDYENRAEKTKGEIKIYLNPVSGTMCFKRESSYGKAGEEFDFIIAFTDGRYMHFGPDENGKKIKTSEKVSDVKPDAETREQQKENFATYCAPTGNKRMDAGFESLEYTLSYASSDTKDKLWITSVPFNVYPLYGFELIEVPASLPASLDYLYLLGPNQLIGELDSKDLLLKLKSISADPFLAVTKDYKEVKVN
jgi:hypothetical protein